MSKTKAILLLLFLIVTVFFLSGFISVWYVLHPQRGNTASASESVVIRASDGITLCGWENVCHPESHKWALLIHSYRASHRLMNPYADSYEQKGYNTLRPDLRAHGASGGNYIGMGYLDQGDIRYWIDYIIEQDQDAEIVLHGISMGGAALMMLCGQDDLPSNIVAVIEDSGYISADTYLRWKIKQKFGLPPFPLLQISGIASKVLAGYSWNEASSITGVLKGHLPILFIHGTDDKTVPVSDAYILYDAAICEKELFIVENAGHGQSEEKAGNEYWEKVFSFINYASSCK